MTNTEQPDWVSYRFSIRIAAPKIDIEQLESLLGLSHTSFLTKGSKLRTLLYRGEIDKWVYNISKCDGPDFAPALSTVESVIATRRSVLSEVRVVLGYETELYLSYHSNLASGGFVLPDSLLNALADSKLSLHVSVLSWGDLSSTDNDSEEEL